MDDPLAIGVIRIGRRFRAGRVPLFT